MNALPVLGRSNRSFERYCTRIPRWVWWTEVVAQADRDDHQNDRGREATADCQGTGLDGQVPHLPVRGSGTILPRPGMKRGALPASAKGPHGRLLTPRHGRRRVQAVRDVVHDDLRRGHPEADRGHLRGGAVLARAAHPDQPELPARHDRREAGRRRAPRARLRRHLPGQPVRREPARRAALALQAPGAGHRARRATARATSSPPAPAPASRSASSSPSSTRCCARRSARAGAAHARHRHLPDERAGQQPAGGARTSSSATSRAPPRSPSPATPARTTPRSARRIADDPPDILLTNFMMLELLMTRQDELDRKVIGNCAGLRLPGARRAAHLPRPAGRRRGAARPPRPRAARARAAPVRRHVGHDGERRDRSRTRTRSSREVASKLFAASDRREQRHRRDARADHRPDARPRPRCWRRARRCHRRGHPADDLRRRARARIRSPSGSRPASASTWSEADQRWQRARPLTVTEAVDAAVGGDAGRAEEACRDALRELLLVSQPPRGDAHQGRRAPASGASSPSSSTSSSPAPATPTPRSSRRASASSPSTASSSCPATPRSGSTRSTSAATAARSTTRSGSSPRRAAAQLLRPRHRRRARQARSGRRHAGTPRRRRRGRRPTSRVEFGFLTLHPPDADFEFADEDEDYPETWLEFDADGQRRASSATTASAARRECSGRAGRQGRLRRSAPGSCPGKFRFCLRCGDTQSSAARDRNRLASLSAEGRSSATTVLVASALRWMHGGKSGLEPFTRKLLGFTDNRQDAALQAGHFNDFLFVSLLRAGFLGALEAAGAAGPAQRASSATRSRRRSASTDAHPGDPGRVAPRARPPGLQPARRPRRRSARCWPTGSGSTSAAAGATRTRTSSSSASSRSTTCGLDELAADEALFAERARRPQARQRRRSAPTVYRELFDHLRKWMAIRSQVLEHDRRRAARRPASHTPPPGAVGLRRTTRSRARARWLFVAPPRTARTSRCATRTSSCAAARAARSARRSATPSSGAATAPSGRSRPKDFDALVDGAPARPPRSIGSSPQETHALRRPARLAPRRRLRPLPARRPPEEERPPSGRPTPSSAPSTPASPTCSRSPAIRSSASRRASTPRRSRARSAQVREKRFRYGEKEREELDGRRGAAPRDRRGQPLPAGALLLADHGARRRHLGAERRLPAQRPADAGQLRPAQRPRRPQRPGRAGAHLLRGAEPARPVLLPRPEGDGARRGAAAAARPRQPRPGREPPPGGLARLHRASRSTRPSPSCWCSTTRSGRSGRELRDADGEPRVVARGAPSASGGSSTCSTAS